MGRVPVPARKPARSARGALAAPARLRALLQCAARHDDGPHRGDLPHRRETAGAGRRAVSAYRTPSGGRVDRSRPLRFHFDGRALEGLHGDSLASALLANGVHLAGRSFKYHRPRGIMTAGAEEPSALVTVRRDAGRETPNLRATQLELYDGLVAESQNRWPSLAFDFGRLNDFLSPLFPAGFYYKTFMWPRGAWAALYEPLIRRAAGLGKAPRRPDPDAYAQRFAHCDVLVVGARSEERRVGKEGRSRGARRR